MSDTKRNVCNFFSISNHFRRLKYGIAFVSYRELYFIFRCSFNFSVRISIFLRNLYPLLFSAAEHEWIFNIYWWSVIWKLISFRFFLLNTVEGWIFNLWILNSMICSLLLKFGANAALSESCAIHSTMWMGQRQITILHFIHSHVFDFGVVRYRFTADPHYPFNS